jgi:hypothetical protein
LLGTEDFAGASWLMESLLAASFRTSRSYATLP